MHHVPHHMAWLFKDLHVCMSEAHHLLAALPQDSDYVRHVGLVKLHVTMSTVDIQAITAKLYIVTHSCCLIS